MKKDIKHIDYEYPSSCGEHIIHPKRREKKRVTDAGYPFIGTGLLYGIYAATLRVLALLLLPLWAFFWMRPKITGKKNLRSLKGEGAIIAANHVHVLDSPVICACAIRIRKIYFPTLTENVDIPVAGSIIKALGGIPLGENFGGMKKFNSVLYDLLRRKKLILFYPEAALWPYYTGLRPFTKGAFIFAKKADAKILPMVYTFKVNKKGLKTRLYLHILPPIAHDGLSADELKNLVYKRMKEVAESFYADPKNNKSGKTIATEFEPQTEMMVSNL